MKLSTLETNKHRLYQTVFKEYGDKVEVSIGLKCLVVIIHAESWSGPLPKEFNNIPVTYLFSYPTNFMKRGK